ncbi:TonB-dependent receptor [bacterium]|nr:TonB-dependent receptor [bacterium]
MKKECVRLILAVSLFSGIFAGAFAQIEGEDPQPQDQSQMISETANTSELGNSTTSESAVFLSEEPAGEPVVMEPMVVTASKIASPLSDVTGSITVITAADIEARKAKDLKEILQGVVGIDLIQNGGTGQLGSVFVRGAASERTLIMINGVPMYDPMSPARNTNIAKITLDNVEQIEVVRGPQSVVFGSSAMGGVINIITKKGKASPQLQLQAEGGKYGTLVTALTANGAIGDLGFALGTSFANTEGFSAAKRSEDFVASEPAPAMEADGDQSLSVDLNLDYQVSDSISLTLMNRFINSNTDIDAFAGNFGDDPNFTSGYTQLLNQFKADWEVMDNLWSASLNVGMNQLDRRTVNETDQEHPVDMSRGEYRSRTIGVDWNNQVSLPFSNTIAVGGHYHQEQGMSHYYSEYLDWYTGAPTSSESQFDVRSSHQFSLYLEERWQWQGLTTVIGARFDNHDQYGGHTTYRITPAYRIDSTRTRIKASYGTAFNAPSLYQLYVDDVYSQGDPALKPETSNGWEAGVEQSFWEDRITLSATYFQTQYQDQIDAAFDSATYKYIYSNTEKAETKGWEAGIQAEPIEKLLLALTYTKLTANDLTNEDTIGPEPLLRRAHYHTSFAARYAFLDTMVTLQVGHVGPRWDSGKKDLEPYTLVNLSVSYRIIPQTQVYVKVHNLLDEDYVEVSGYSTSRFAVYSGIEIDLP